MDERNQTILLIIWFVNLNA